MSLRYVCRLLLISCLPVSSTSGGFVVKNFNTLLLETPKMPSLPPVISFPGLLNSMNQSNVALRYDNTTCEGRYCRLAVVTRSLVDRDCDNDINLCTSTDLGAENSFPMCIDNLLALRCTIWVPSKTNSREDFWIIFGVCFVAWLILLVITVLFTGDGICIWIITGIALLVAFLSIVAESDYSHWMSNTLVDKDYASYQSCVTYCNSNLNDDSLLGQKSIAMNMCQDGDNKNNPFAIWPANFNPYTDPQNKCNLGASFKNSYCSSCLSVSGDWKKTRDAASYVRIKSYVVIVICLIFGVADIMYGFIDRGNRFQVYESIFQYVFRLIVFLVFWFYLICFVLSWIYVTPLIHSYGEISLVHDILKSQGGGIPIIDICGAYIAVDFVSGLFFFLYGAMLTEAMGNVRNKA